MSADELLNVVDAANYLGIRPWTLRHWVSDGKIEIVKYGNGIVRIRRSVLDRFVAGCTIKARQSNGSNRTRNRDYSKGPVWDAATSRWLVEIRYPNGSRFRKRMRCEREALRLWAGENAKIENGTWDERAARNVTAAEAMKQYRDFSHSYLHGHSALSRASSRHS